MLAAVFIHLFSITMLNNEYMNRINSRAVRSEVLANIRSQQLTKSQHSNVAKAFIAVFLVLIVFSTVCCLINV